MVASMLSNPR